MDENDNSTHEALGNSEVSSHVKAEALLGHPEHHSEVAFQSLSPCYQFPQHLREQSLLMQTQNEQEVARVPVGKLCVTPESQPLSQLKHPVPSQQTGSLEAGRPLGSFAFFFFLSNWGVY